MFKGIKTTARVRTRDVLLMASAFGVYIGLTVSAAV